MLSARHEARHWLVNDGHWTPDQCTLDGVARYVMCVAVKAPQPWTVAVCLNGHEPARA